MIPCDASSARISALVCLVLTVFLPAGAARAQSRCADCHFANADRAPRPGHLEEWDRSPHGRNNVGCEKCHGGNDRTTESSLAHVGIVPPGIPASPVHRRNLPTTCGRCHVAAFVAFQDSTHYKLLRTGDDRGPTCSTCHGDADGRLLSPNAIAGKCNQCHGPRGTAPREGRSRDVRQHYEDIRAVRSDLRLAESFIRRVSAGERRDALDRAYRQAEVPAMRAVTAGHKFVYDELRDYLAIARERVEALINSLANR